MLRFIWVLLWLYVTANVLLAVYLFWNAFRELLNEVRGARQRRDNS